jgi:thioredoxin
METEVKRVVHQTTQEFKEKVFNYEINKEWKYEGTLPAIVDFYADWCMPCKMVAPMLEELAQQYAGKIVVYKVNTENEQELASVFGIQSIPTLLFIPREGQPQSAMGALPKQTFEKVIKELLLNN